jgi:hypothetical protein
MFKNFIYYRLVTYLKLVPDLNRVYGTNDMKTLWQPGRHLHFERINVVSLSRNMIRKLDLVLYVANGMSSNIFMHYRNTSFLRSLCTLMLPFQNHFFRTNQCKLYCRRSQFLHVRNMQCANDVLPSNKAALIVSKLNTHYTFLSQHKNY